MTIQYLGLHTAHLAATQNFYETVLGFPLLSASDKHIVFQVGNTHLAFEQSDSDPHYHFAFHIPKNQLQEALKWVQSKVDLIAPYSDSWVTSFPNWNAEAFYFYDNQGNILECIARNDLHNESDAEFTIDSFLGISEVGIVCDSPLDLSTEIRTQTGVPFFQNGPQTAEFSAVGTHSGLFVISNPNRNWFPTEKRAKKSPVKTKIGWNNQNYSLAFNSGVDFATNYNLSL